MSLPEWLQSQLAYREALAAHPWPTETIARYLTVGGATVDVTQTERGVRAHCHGCPDAKSDSKWTALFRSDLTGPDSAAQATQEAAAWAQRHAETCRAMPKPGSEA